MTDHPAEEFFDRLDAVEIRLRDLATRDMSSDKRTAPDSATGETWDQGQVWAHLAEILPYWIAQARMVIEKQGSDPVPFGRVKSNPERIAAIERNRKDDIATLRNELTKGIAGLRTFLGDITDDEWTSARGLHQTMGIMSLPRIVDEFMVGHLEEHAAQLETLL